MSQEFYLIDKSVLPDIFSKVIEAKRLLQTGKCKTVNDATKTVNISRSVFYKYKDSVHVFVEKDKQNIITIILYLIFPVIYKIKTGGVAEKKAHILSLVNVIVVSMLEPIYTSNKQNLWFEYTTFREGKDSTKDDKNTQNVDKKRTIKKAIP